MIFGKFQYVERVFVASNEHAAEIIGPGGYKVKAIAKQTRTFISCPSPLQPPIFEIFGSCRSDVLIAKKLVQSFANHFDEMRSKKRRIHLESDDDMIATVALEKNDIPFIIGRKGRQIKKIMRIAEVNIISPDTNKLPIFIITGREANIKRCVFWMKLTAFVASGRDCFSSSELHLIRKYANGIFEDSLLPINEIVNANVLKERIKRINFQANIFCAPKSCKKSFWCCWKCKKNCERVALALCGHKISCDKCIQHLFSDIYLRCFYCTFKVESFIIQDL